MSIPQRYESFAQPISCARLWFDARRANTGAPAGPPAVGACIGAPPPDRGLETPFVVKLWNHARGGAVLMLEESPRDARRGGNCVERQCCCQQEHPS